ncbi:MAG: hypothetical protein OEZ06_14250 [Myxococcales bacterium]|nr:hypothetical protein [Myxococcales bacterium]
MGCTDRFGRSGCQGADPGLHLRPWPRLPSACRRSLLLGLCGIATILAPARGAHAYSAFADYLMPVQDGGGGGRFFTGTPADGYGCDLCHEGADGADLEITGLPLDGYEAGMGYEITFTWDANAPHVALIAELSDGQGQPAGTIALAPYASFGEDELCESGDFPAADVCYLDREAGGCCRELQPGTDACSFPDMRSALWVPDCGSRSARMVWTAPDGGDAWLGVSMVTSNLENDALGDGVTSVRELLRPHGASRELSTLEGDCAVATGPGAKDGAMAGPGAAIISLLLSALLRLRARAKR